MRSKQARPPTGNVPLFLKAAVAAAMTMFAIGLVGAVLLEQRPDRYTEPPAIETAEVHVRGVPADIEVEVGVTWDVDRSGPRGDRTEVGRPVERADPARRAWAFRLAPTNRQVALTVWRVEGTRWRTWLQRSVQLDPLAPIEVEVPPHVGGS